MRLAIIAVMIFGCVGIYLVEGSISSLHLWLAALITLGALQR